MAGDGLKTAVGMAVEAADEPARAEQLPLLPAELIEALPDEPAERRAAIAAPRKAGRPAGARNRSTVAMAQYLLRRYRSPLEVLAETYSRPARDLATELGCDLVTAFGLQQRAAAELAPYLHGKMPVEVAVTTNAPMLVLGDPSALAAAYHAAAEGEDLGPLVDVVAGVADPVEEGGDDK